MDEVLVCIISRTRSTSGEAQRQQRRRPHHRSTVYRRRQIVYRLFCVDDVSLAVPRHRHTIDAFDQCQTASAVTSRAARQQLAMRSPPRRCYRTFDKRRWEMMKLSRTVRLFVPSHGFLRFQSERSSLVMLWRRARICRTPGKRAWIASVESSTLTTRRRQQVGRGQRRACCCQISIGNSSIDAISR